MRLPGWRFLSLPLFRVFPFLMHTFTFFPHKTMTFLCLTEAQWTWNRKEEGRAQILKEWHSLRTQLIRTKQVHEDEALSLSTCSLEHTSKLTGMPTSTTRALRPTIKGQNACRGPSAGNLCSFSPEEFEYSSHFSSYETAQLIKATHSTFHGHTCLLRWPTLLSVEYGPWAAPAFWDGPVCAVISL